MVSAWYVGGTRGSGIVSSAADVLWMRGVVKCVRCVCVWLGDAWTERGGEWMRGLGLGFTNPIRTGGMLDVCLCLSCGGVGGVGGELVGGLDHGLEGWGAVMSV